MYLNRKVRPLRRVRRSSAAVSVRRGIRSSRTQKAVRSKCSQLDPPPTSPPGSPPQPAGWKGDAATGSRPPLAIGFMTTPPSAFITTPPSAPGGPNGETEGAGAGAAVTMAPLLPDKFRSHLCTMTMSDATVWQSAGSRRVPLAPACTVTLATASTIPLCRHNKYSRHCNECLTVWLVVCENLAAEVQAVRRWRRAYHRWLPHLAALCPLGPSP